MAINRDGFTFADADRTLTVGSLDDGTELTEWETLRSDKRSKRVEALTLYSEAKLNWPASWHHDTTARFTFDGVSKLSILHTEANAPEYSPIEIDGRTFFSMFPNLTELRLEFANLHNCDAASFAKVTSCAWIAPAAEPKDIDAALATLQPNVTTLRLDFGGGLIAFEPGTYSQTVDGILRGRFQKTQDLAIVGCGDPHLVSQLIKSPLLAGLKTLDISSNVFSEADLESLIEHSGRFHHLHSFKLSECSVDANDDDVDPEKFEDLKRVFPSGNLHLEMEGAWSHFLRESQAPDEDESTWEEEG